MFASRRLPGSRSPASMVCSPGCVLFTGRLQYRSTSLMPSSRYTILLADRQTGVMRRFTVGLRPALAVIGTIVTLPILIGMGAAWKAKSDVADLYASHTTLELELSSYRETTEALTGQIQGLQTALDDLGGRSALDPALRSAMDKLPAIVKSRAMGGGTEAGSAGLALLPSITSPL